MLQNALAVALDAAREAGEILRRDFHRPEGPRGKWSHAEADDEAEQAIRARLEAAFPDWGYLGEETGSRPGDPCWVVDPNDGTASYLKGMRGSAVSIALIREGLPVLGVVYAPLYPDDRGDLVAWAEGCGPPTRNGVPLPDRRFAEDLDLTSTVLVSQDADGRPRENLRCVTPARYRSMPSIAYRLALVAAGEGEAAVSLSGPCSWDYAGGHALVRAFGGDLLDGSGVPIRYGDGGYGPSTNCFGGAPGPCRELALRPWDGVFASGPVSAREPFPFPVRVRPGKGLSDPDLLARAHGLMLGQLAGDSLGGLVEFQGPDTIARLYPQGPRRLEDGGQWKILAGQPTDDSEMALALSRTLVREGGFEGGAVLEGYRAWLDTGPFDCGTTTRRGLAGVPNPDSQANGSLMRCSPLALAALGGSGDGSAWAAEDSRLTHPHPLCVDACRSYVAALGAALRGGSPREAFEAAWHAGGPEIREILREAEQAPPGDFTRNQGWVRLAFQNAFYRLLHSASPEEGLVETVRQGGDTDTNGAIAGALLGAVHGREALPAQWRLAILTCRPHRSFEGAAVPRPRWLWPVDALELAEALAAG